MFALQWNAEWVEQVEAGCLSTVLAYVNRNWPSTIFKLEFVVYAYVRITDLLP